MQQRYWTKTVWNFLWLFLWYSTCTNHWIQWLDAFVIFQNHHENGRCRRIQIRQQQQQQQQQHHPTFEIGSTMTKIPLLRSTKQSQQHYQRNDIVTVSSTGRRMIRDDDDDDDDDDNKQISTTNEPSIISRSSSTNNNNWTWKWDGQCKAASFMGFFSIVFGIMIVPLPSPLFVQMASAGSLLEDYGTDYQTIQSGTAASRKILPNKPTETETTTETTTETATSKKKTTTTTIQDMQVQGEEKGDGTSPIVQIDPTLRGSYYYPTAKKRYLPRIQRVSQELSNVPKYIETNDWVSLQEFGKIAENSILPLYLYQSSLTGQGLSLSNTYAKNMKQDALLYEASYKDFIKAYTNQDMNGVIDSISQMAIAITDYRQQGRLSDDNGYIPSVDEIKRMTMRRPTVKINNFPTTN